jgi:hypothetical protein
MHINIISLSERANICSYFIKFQLENYKIKNNAIDSTVLFHNEKSYFPCYFINILEDSFKKLHLRA